MLLMFSIEGFLSFEDCQEIYFLPYKGARLRNTKYEDNFFLDLKNRPMKSSVFFGDNASGKTNLIYGLARLKNIILEGLNDLSEDAINNNKDSVRFEIVVADEDNNEFYYKIKYNREGEVLEEGLSLNDRSIYEFSNHVLELNYAKDEEDIKLLEKIYSNKSTNTFLVKLRDIFYQEVDGFLKLINKLDIVTENFFNPEIKYLRKVFDINYKELVEENKSVVLDILKTLDTTIEDVDFEKTLNERGQDRYEIIIKRGEKNFPLYMESQGVKKIIFLLNDILSIFSGDTVIIDELDSSISAKALIKIFNNFINSDRNKKGQLIITSHNLQLLDLDIFHESQLNIVQKDTSLKTRVISISDFDHRSEKKNLDLEFLKGSFDIYES